MNNQSIKELENQLNEAKKKNADLTNELVQKEQMINQFKEQNELFQLYNDLKKDDISYQSLMDLKDIPIPDDLKNAVQQRSESENKFSETQEKLKRIINFLAGPDKAQEILKSDEKTYEFLDFYIKVSNEISNGL